jgi:carbon monoxide dehydrogenase subunit G
VIRCENAIEVSVPPAEAFATVDDHQRAPRWLSRCIEIRQTSDGPKSVGTTLLYRYHERGREGSMSGSVTEYAKDQALAMRFSDAMAEIRLAFRFAPSGAGTRIDETVEVVLKGLVGKLMSPLIGRLAKAQVENDGRALKALIEARA